jgi:dynein heavy chain
LSDCIFFTCPFFVCVQVPFTMSINTVECRGAVEKWLLQVQDVMLMSVRDVVEKAVIVSGDNND